MATIRVNDEIKEQIEEIKNMRGDKNTNETIKSLIPQGIKTEEGYLQEPPAFTILNILVSWNELKESEIGKSWKSFDESATVLFHDEFGSLVRFMIGGDIWVEYFHFL